MKLQMTAAKLWFAIAVCSSLLPFVRRAAADQPALSTTQVQGNIPSYDAHIVTYRVDTTDPGDFRPTGNLSIEYSDGTKVIERVPSVQKAGQNFKEVGFNDVRLSSDKRVIAWLELFENPGTSYPIPEALAIYRSGKTIIHIAQGQMIWDWFFLDDGRRISAVWGLTHGPEQGDYQLYDATTGHMLAEFFGNPQDNSHKSDTPTWVSQMDQMIRTKDLNRK